MEIVPFSKIRLADLQVDAVYQGGRMGNAGDDPLPHLLNVSNSGGFRYRGSLDSLELVVLTSSLRDPDWPDMLDPETGVYTYYGDNKRPGRGLHETPRKGNELSIGIERGPRIGVQKGPLFVGTSEVVPVVNRRGPRAGRRDLHMAGGGGPHVGGSC